MLKIKNHDKSVKVVRIVLMSRLGSCFEPNLAHLLHLLRPNINLTLFHKAPLVKQLPPKLPFLPNYENDGSFSTPRPSLLICRGGGRF